MDRDTPGSAPPRRIRVLVVDDHALVREGICELLAQQGDLEVVAVAESAEAAIAAVARDRPDVALVDFRLADGSGLDVLQQVHDAEQATRVVILSAFDDPEYVTESLARGAAGYLLKTATGEELAGAVRAVAAGAVVLEPDLVQLLGRPRLAADQPLPNFTRREAQVLACLANGWSNRRTADALGLNVRTVEGHVTELLAKLGASSRTEAALWAARHGVVPAGQPGP